MTQAPGDDTTLLPGVTTTVLPEQVDNAMLCTIG
jgi:hypothetical protein